jgi:hypothetical protein
MRLAEMGEIEHRLGSHMLLHQISVRVTSSNSSSTENPRGISFCCAT